MKQNLKQVGPPGISFKIQKVAITSASNLWMGVEHGWYVMDENHKVMQRLYIDVVNHLRIVVDNVR